MNPNPGCEGECRFQEKGPMMTTCMYYPPVYDKHGNNTNPDGNITSGALSCLTCGKKWSFATRYGETQYTEVK